MQFALFLCPKTTKGGKQVDIERKILTIPEVAQTLGISRGLAYQLAKQGELPGLVRIGQKRVVCSKEAVERFLRGNTSQKQD
jgi:excisionase family DNA binding protein